MFETFSEVPAYPLVFPIFWGAFAIFALMMVRRLRVFEAVHTGGPSALSDIPARAWGVIQYAFLQTRMFTESLTYQWLATAGNYSSGRTGGPRDAFGNDAPLFTDWTAPKAEDLEGPTNVELWFIQRDERLGLAWYEGCLRVVP